MRARQHAALEKGEDDTVRALMAALAEKGWAGKQMAVADDRKWTPMHLAAMRDRILPEVGASAAGCAGDAHRPLLRPRYFLRVSDWTQWTARAAHR